MVWNRIDLKNFAKDSMRKNYGACVLAAFLISLHSFAVTYVRL